MPGKGSEMKLTLTRKEFLTNGVLSELISEDGCFVALVIERTYANKGKKSRPKLKHGEYTCVKGMHRLASMEKDFETFEVSGVTGHTGILFHVGNYPEDSDGCLLVGRGIGYRKNGEKMICDSRKKFAEFMEMLKDHSEFTLKVEVI